MLKKTRDSKYKTTETVQSLDRKLMAVTKDIADVRYEYEEEEEDPAASSAPAESPPSSAHPPIEDVAEPKLLPAAVAAVVEDAPVTRLDIVRAIVAAKLKKPMSQVQTSKSLSELSLGKSPLPIASHGPIITRALTDISKGKSALQNELIGDIDAEFNSIPDRAESLALATLADTLPHKPGGEFGKPVSRLLSRWFSGCMPASFGAAVAREHLRAHWGLEKGRQSSVLLFALTQSIASASMRLDSVGEAKVLLDAAVGDYSHSCGVSLKPVSMSMSMSTSVSATAHIDASMLATLTAEPRRLAEAQKTSLDRYLGLDEDSPAAQEKVAALEQTQHIQQERLDRWLAEFGPEFELGIQPRFSARKLRHFNFSWNQARLELLQRFDAVVSAKEKAHSQQDGDCETPHSLLLLRRLADKCTSQGLTLAEQLESQAIADYGQESYAAAFARVMIHLIARSLARGAPLCQLSEHATRPVTRVLEDGGIQSEEIPRLAEKSYVQLISTQPSHIRLSRRKVQPELEKQALTSKMHNAIADIINHGVTFSGKIVLITGAGSGSIGAEIVKGLLKGGATVIVTTSRDITDAQHFFRSIYAECGARGSELYVLPFNQASVVDCRALVDYISNDLKLHIDVLIPLAAMPERGIEVQDIGELSELAHRMMMTNTMRLLGMIISKKADVGRMMQILLPLSPNHGIFGGDGLYSESKLGLESLMERVSSESWGERVSVCGVLIGWTRGTGLMAANDIVAETVESHGALTFTTSQMALNMLALLAPTVSELWEDEPILADFSGGLRQVANLKALISKAREDIRQQSLCKKAVMAEDALENSMLPDQLAVTNDTKDNKTVHNMRSRFQLPFPRLPDYSRDLLPLSQLRDMVDLTDTIVIVGYSELGPWGSSRTRWEMESKQMLSQQGHIELAWVMGLIKHDPKGGGWIDTETGQHLADYQIPTRFGKKILDGSGIRVIHPASANGYDPAKKTFLQEVAVESDLPPFETSREAAEAFKLKHGDFVTIRNLEGRDSYRVQIKSGARIMVPKAIPHHQTTVAGMLPDGWDPHRYGIPDDIVNQSDPVTLYALICASEAFLCAGIENPMEVFRHIHVSELGNYMGCSLGGVSKNREMYRDIFLDKPVQSDVISETMINSPAAWINLLLLGASGPIKTPSGACATALESIDGGVESIRLGKTRMCLVGGVDPFHEDEEYAFATLKATVDSGQQFAEGRQPKEMSRPSAETRAGFVDAPGGGALLICDAQLALEMGLPVYGVVAGTGMAADKIGRSIPAPGQGLLTFAREAPGAKHSALLDLGYRRREIESAIGRLLALHPTSIPTTTSSSKSSSSDTDYIKISGSSKSSLDLSTDSSNSSSPRPLQADSLQGGGELDTPVLLPSPCSIRLESPPPSGAEAIIQAQIRAIRRQWSTGIRNLDPGISPMRAALAVWGLDVDDIVVASMHGTSTKANDTNEAETINKQMAHLGRTASPLFVVSQKSVTGHGKAAAAAWMLNGCLQALDSSLVPGNFALDNIDSQLARYEHLVYPTETVLVGGDGIKAFLLNSFGFGQKGAQIVGVAPRYLFATLGSAAYTRYVELCTQRKRLANRAFAKAMLENKVVKARSRPPYMPEDESSVLLNPYARASWSGDHKEVYFSSGSLTGV